MITQMYRFREQGFTLVEMAMVLLIVALLLGGLVPTLSGQIEQRRNSETSKQLDEIQQALIGFAVINGRLPCPANPTMNTGVEDPLGGSTAAIPCGHPYDGYLPVATLGLSGANSAGFAVDSWGNPIRYAVTKWNNNTFTTPNGMKLAGISTLLPTGLLVCSTAPIPALPGTNCNAGTSLTPNGAPAVIFSTGKNGPLPNGVDEQANLDGTNVTFVSHTPTPSPNQFDDIVIWISPNTLINRMVAAGQLP
jgi:prepilin-type N-terminal cleavage/methylation domain-containing protein